MSHFLQDVIQLSKCLFQLTDLFLRVKVIYKLVIIFQKDLPLDGVIFDLPLDGVIFDLPLDGVIFDLPLDGVIFDF